MQTDLFRRNPARPSALTIYNAVLGALDAPTADVMEQDRTFYLGVIKDALDAKYGPVKAAKTRSKGIKLPKSVVFVLETEVSEIASDPTAYGLSSEEIEQYRALYAAWDRENDRLILPQDAQSLQRISDLLTSLSNAADAQGDAQGVSLPEAGALATLGNKVNAKLRSIGEAPPKAPRIERAPSMGRNTEVGNWLHSSYEGTGEFVVDTAWLGGANEAVARSFVERQLLDDISKWLDRDKMVVSIEAREKAARIIRTHGDDFANSAFAYFGNGAKPYVYDPKFIEGWLRSIGEVTEEPVTVEVVEELPNAIPFGPKEIVPNDVIWIGNKSKLYVVFRTGVITLKEDALSPYTRKLMAEKGEEIPILYATALSGGDKGSIVRVFGGKLADLSTQPQTTYFDVPIFYGAPKSVKKRYDAYVKYMTDAGNESLIVPLVESNAKPVEPDAPIPESDASYWDADVRLTHSVDKGTLIDWEDGKDHPQFNEIKAIIRGRGKGFKWSRNLGSWYRPQSVGLLETRVDVGRLVNELHGLGLTVHLDLEVSDDVEAAVSRKKEHLEQRADMYSERAQKLRTAAGTQADYAQQKAKEAITKMKIPGYFPTPDELAYKMATVAELQPGMEVLEPSAGHGALVDAIQRRVRSVGGGEDPTPAIVDAMEINADLRGLLKEQGIPVVSFDIMHPNDYPIGTYYDRVIMNPPYEKGQSIDHVLKAYGYVKPGGILVALMPESIMYRKDKKHELFRDWMEMEDAQIFDIERQKFGRSGEIKTRIIKVKKPRDAKMVVAAGKALTRQKEARADARISGGALQASREATRGIPMGQPILRGHHSQRKHSRAVEKADRAMAKARELNDKARLAQSRARSLERTTVGAVDVTKGGRTAAAAAPKGYATGPRKKKATPLGLTAAKIKGLIGANKGKAEWGVAPYRAQWGFTWNHPEWKNKRGLDRTTLFVDIEQPGKRDYFRNRNEVFPGVAWGIAISDRLSHWVGQRDEIETVLPDGTPTDEAALIIADMVASVLPPQLASLGEKKREALRRKLAKAKTRENPSWFY